MKVRTTQLFNRLCGIAVLLAVLVSMTVLPAGAVSNGIYLATASPHYKNPITGTIEDSGGEGSSVLGQSMTESATYKQALVEVDASGNTFITVRLQLMDNIENPQFQVAAAGTDSFSAVSAALMQENYTDYTSDYRMQVPDENAVIRCNMYVTAMGREVIFYITVSDLVSGSGDFITSIQVSSTQQAASSQSAASGTSSAAGDAATSAVSATASVQEETSLSSEAGSGETAGENNAETSGDAASGDGEVSSTASAAGLAEFDTAGSLVETDASKTGETATSGGAAGWIIGITAVVLIAGGCIWYFLFYKKRKGAE